MLEKTIRYTISKAGLKVTSPKVGAQCYAHNALDNGQGVSTVLD